MASVHADLALRRDAVEALRASWDAAARDNAQWHVVTIPGQSEDEFYESGRLEVQGMLGRLAELHVIDGEAPLDLAMDFGCGLGRVSTALGSYFRKVVAVDVSGEMIRRARRHKRVRYLRASTLDVFRAGVYDLIYTNITLQHMPGWLQQLYVQDFYRLARPGGAVVFQLPVCERLEHVQHALMMSGAPLDEVTGWVEAAGGELVAAEPSGAAGPQIDSYQYITRRTHEV